MGAPLQIQDHVLLLLGHSTSPTPNDQPPILCSDSQLQALHSAGGFAIEPSHEKAVQGIDQAHSSQKHEGEDHDICLSIQKRVQSRSFDLHTHKQLPDTKRLNMPMMQLLHDGQPKLTLATITINYQRLSMAISASCFGKSLSDETVFTLLCWWAVVVRKGRPFNSTPPTNKRTNKPTQPGD